MSDLERPTGKDTMRAAAWLIDKVHAAIEDDDPPLASQQQSRK
jgi:hypothetical protein